MIPPMQPASFQPYGFLLHPRDRRSPTKVNATAAESSDDEHPQQPEQPYTPALLSETEHGAYLAHACDYIVPPQITPTDPAELPASARCLFIGHLRFETTTADVRWMIKKLTDVNPLRADIRGNGCCVVYLSSEQDANAVRLLSRRILFDRHGFWFARTGDSVDILMDYVEKVLPALGCTGTKRRSLRLPRDAIVVEDSRSSKQHRRKQQQQQAPSTVASTPSHPAHRMPSTPMLKQVSPMVHGHGFHGANTPAYATANFHDCPPDYALPADGVYAQ